MKKVELFYLKNCPFCKKGFQYLEELRSENPEYAKIEIEMIEESVEAERAAQYDYWLVPTYFVDGEKLHEGVLDKQKLKTVLDAALAPAQARASG
ncbi:MAG: glutaredoxin family protein [Christensenellales bacterium]|jgi:glutaredoxin